VTKDAILDCRIERTQSQQIGTETHANTEGSLPGQLPNSRRMIPSRDKLVPPRLVKIEDRFGMNDFRVLSSQNRQAHLRVSRRT
jgi:hypothetical protein